MGVCMTSLSFCLCRFAGDSELGPVSHWLAQRYTRKVNMDAQLGQTDSPFGIGNNFVKYHLPYFTPVEVEQLSEKQRGKLSVTQEERARQLACGFIENVGAKLGL